MTNYIKFFATIVLFTILSACAAMKGKGINLFTIQQDRDLGAQVAAEIDANRNEYPLLDSASNKAIYAYIYKIRDKILNSGKVAHKDDFGWRIRIIKDDNTLNAFCTPGGYIYVYTGILKYLDSEDQFAGVLGHEIAHADLRHSTRQMTKIYGIQTLLDILAGKQEMLKEVTAGLINLKFSRQHETEADQFSVEYLCPTDYNADGGAGFFQKIASEGGAKQPQFLSTHPNPDNRIEHFHTAKKELNCTGNKDYKSDYKIMISRLPN